MKERRIFTIPARPTPVVIFCIGNYLFIFGPHICSTNQNFWIIIMINKLIKSNVIFLYIYKTQFQNQIHKIRICPFFFLFGYAMFGLWPHTMLRLPTRVERCFVMILVIQFNFTFVLVLSGQSWFRVSKVQFVHYTSNFWTTLLLWLLTGLSVG